MNETEAKALFEDILKIVGENLSETVNNKWIKPLKIKSVKDNVITLIAPNAFMRDYITDRFLKIVEFAALEATNKTYKVTLTAEETKMEPKQPEIVTMDELFNKDTPTLSAHAGLEWPEPIAPGDPSTLIEKYTFETFVTGKSNQLAHAAAIAVADKPGEAYNPFFMYGGVGLGKTHLMQAIGHFALKNNPAIRVLYMTSETFTNELINAIQQKKTFEFRERIRSADILMVDDGSKDRTWSEICALHDNDPMFRGLKLAHNRGHQNALYAGLMEARKDCDLSISIDADLQDDVSVTRQRYYDEMYEDLNDLISVICPIENEKDPVWEKGARSIIMSTCLAMLEDSEDERLNMTKDKFNFFNLNKALTNSENEFQALKDYFEGRSKLSQAYTLSRQVLSAADTTLSSYMSITFDKLNMFNDRGLCGLTSATDVQAEKFAYEPTALFMKIPDEKDTRHGLAAVFILCMYKALIKVASAREDLSLPRNVYFILDEFGNMPKIEKFDKMITVGRSRKIWFNMVVQSYSQLNNVYGEKVADIVKSNCGMKMFIGSNDIGTCEEFSKLCGNMTVRTTSTSASIAGKAGDMNVSSQTQVRPLIYPSELQMLNNKESTGNAIIVTFGNYPLKTKYTPSYLCPFYKMGRMDMDELRSHMFRADEVFYDLDVRNEIVLGKEEDGEEDGEYEAS